MRWVGYSPEDDTWEPRDNIVDESLISEFDERCARIEADKAKRKLAEEDPKLKPAKSLRALVWN